jgi:hypothetical protein
MIVAAEMQHAMDQQRHEFLFHRPAGRLGLTPSRRHRDHDVAQVGGILIEVMRCSSFSKRECQNVRTAILVPEAAIEPPHSPIAYEREMHVCRRLTGEREDSLRQPQDSSASDCHRPDIHLKGHGH